MSESPYARRAYFYLEQGYCVIPIAPGTKRPGSYSEADGWRGMHDWERFFKRMPTEIETEIWDKWPDAGIGLLLGKQSGVIGLDRDYDTDGTDALDRLIPYTPVKKKGKKGYTAFFRFNGEKSCSFNIRGMRVLDVLSEGRQTLMPGTLHPDGITYIYLTEDSLEEIKPADLPVLPDNFLDLVAATLAPYQSAEDKKYSRRGYKDTDDKIDTDLSVSQAYFRELNNIALRNLDAWVPKLVHSAKPERDGYRCIATWRNCEKPNVGIHPKGIFDWGGNYPMTALSLVMYANGLPFQKAADMLRSLLPMPQQEQINLTVGGKASAAASTVLPWMRPTSAPAAPVMLPPQTSFDPAPAIPSYISEPPGIMGEIARWINATAPKLQPELAVAAAIALCSTVMGRNYRSQFGNWTSLYMVMVAKSTEGKEHPQACVERILTAAGLENLIGGSGYTSAGAVYSALLKAPAHIATIDELGKLLKISRASGQAHSEAAIDKLIEAFGRGDGVMRPPTYSTMTLSKAQAAGTERMVHNPSITLLGATTPGTFYSALTTDLIMDGFLGRCVVVESSQPRQTTRLVPRTDPPARIIDWCKAVYITGQVDGNLAGVPIADQPASPIELPFDEACTPMMQALEAKLNDIKDESEGEGLDVILGRTVEKSMRLAMIVAKASDPKAKVIKAAHLDWAIAYIQHYDIELVRAVRRERIASQSDADIKRAVKFIRGAAKYASDKRYGVVCAQGLMPHSKLLKLMGMSAKAFSELMQTAVESRVIDRSPMVAEGYNGDVYAVIGE